MRVLYVSPLRALNNDIQRNLLAPLAELERAFAAAGESAAPVRVLTRSGDTPSGERQRMVRRPPEILITTPESLNILLTSKGGRSILGDVASVVLDEIHAVAGSKRGVHLITAVERLVRLAGEFQRLALSATVRPLERVARFVGGYRLEPGAEGAEPRYRSRPVATVRAASVKRYDLKVCAPAAPLPAATDSIWEPLASDIRGRIRANRSTLVFANSRRTTEKLTRFLNEGEPEELAYSHHGSLSREIRAVVEERLKEGRLSGIVATNSLELGIDIGALDEVVLVQTPPSVAAAVQRIGRAGHRVGETSRGRLYPLHERDVLDAAVVAKGVVDGDIEELVPVRGALDVLAQVVLSMVAAERWRLDELYDELRASYPYRHLRRRQFDLVLEMLAGRYADSRIRELRPRLALETLDGTVRARPGTARLVYLSGGTIPDRGYFQLRRLDSMARLGELDEEFVWERSIGDSFTLGAQSWRIRKITHNDVLVSPARKGAAMAPFWRAEPRNRSFHLSRRIGEFLERAERHLAARGGAAELGRYLTGELQMEEAAAARLLELLARQRAVTGAELPHRHHLLVERLGPGGGASPGRADREQTILHFGWGGRVLRPLALAMKAAWRAEHGWPLELEHDNDALIVALPPAFDPLALLELVRPDNVEKLLAGELERERLLRRPLPRERRPGAAAAARRLPPPDAAVAQPRARQEAAGGGLGLRRLPARRRDLAHLPRGRVRAGRPEAAPGRARRRPHPALRVPHRLAVALRRRPRLEADQPADVRGRRARERPRRAARATCCASWSSPPSSGRASRPRCSTASSASCTAPGRATRRAPPASWWSGSRSGW